MQQPKRRGFTHLTGCLVCAQVCKAGLTLARRACRKCSQIRTCNTHTHSRLVDSLSIMNALNFLGQQTSCKLREGVCAFCGHAVAAVWCQHTLHCRLALRMPWWLFVTRQKLLGVQVLHSCFCLLHPILEDKTERHKGSRPGSHLHCHSRATDAHDTIGVRCTA